MATKSNNSLGKNKQTLETSQSIEEQTKAFLKKGGKIQYINSGVSGMQTTSGPKHITLGNNKPR